MGLDSLNNGLKQLSAFASANPILTTAGAIGAAAAGVLGTAAIVGAVKRRKSSRSKNRSSRKRGSRIKHTSRGWKQDRKRFNKRQKWEVAYRKRKMKRKGKIYYARKTGQPYIILASGKAKFIKGKRRKR